MYFVKFTDDKVRWVGTQAQFVEFLEYMHVLFAATDTGISITQLGDIFLKIILIDISPYKSIDEMLEAVERIPVEDNVQKALDIHSLAMDLHETMENAQISPNEDLEMSATDIEREIGLQEFLRLMQRHFDFQED